MVNFTLEQARLACVDAVKTWHASSLKFAKLDLAGRLEFTPEQQETFRQRMVSHVYVNGAINAFDVEKLVGEMADENELTVLAFKDVPAKHRQLPHSDIPELDRIRTVADVERLRSKPEWLKSLRNLRPGSHDYAEVNARIKFILENELAGPETPSAKDAAAKSSTPESAEILEARSLVANIRPSHFGGTTSSATGGRYAQLQKAQERLTRDINYNVRRGVKPADILKYVRLQIDALASSSVR